MIDADADGDITAMVNAMVASITEAVTGHDAYLALAALNLATLAVALTEADGQIGIAEVLLRGQLEDALDAIADNEQAIAIERQGGMN